MFFSQICEQKLIRLQDALVILVRGLRVDVLEQCFGRVAVRICKIGAPSGVSLALMIMKKCNARHLQLTIMENCFAHRMREGKVKLFK